MIDISALLQITGPPVQLGPKSTLVPVPPRVVPVLTGTKGVWDRVGQFGTVQDGTMVPRSVPRPTWYRYRTGLSYVVPVPSTTVGYLCLGP